MNKQNIALIGMAGSGKSSVGVVLAQSLGWNFIDIDVLLEREHGKPLQDILDQAGEDSFQELESAKVMEQAHLDATVIAPGGSIVYSQKAMEVLKNISTVVYLVASLDTILQRIDVSSRGIVGLRDRSFAELFVEREKLYQRYADIEVSVLEKNPAQIAEEIATQF